MILQLIKKVRGAFVERLDKALMTYFIDLILNLIHEKKVLNEKLKNLEFDNWTMRTTLSQMKLVGENATKELASIKVSILSSKERKNLLPLQNDQSLVVCLLDGDGAIFSPEYLKQGEHGGRRAAVSAGYC